MHTAGLLLVALATTPLVAQGVPDAPAVLWHHAGTGPPRRPPTFFKGMLYVGGKKLCALNPETGAVLYEVREPGPWRQPVVHRDVVVACREDGSVQAFFFTLDRKLWQTKRLRSPRETWFSGVACSKAFVLASGTEVLALALADGSEMWRRDVGSAVEMTPATDGVRVYLATHAGSVLALDGATGEPAWRLQTGAEFGWSDPTIADGTLFVADRGIGGRINPADRGKRTDEVKGPRGGALHAFDAATGKHLWGRVFGATGFSTPHLHGDRIWAGFGRSVAPFDRATGAIDFDSAVRTGANAFGSPTVIGDRLVFGNLDGHLYVHDLASGALTWAFRPGGLKPQVGAFLFRDGRFFVRTTNGLYALGDDPGAAPVAPGYVLRAPEER